MSKKLVRRGRVRGYRPSRKQLEEMLELAQRGIDGPVVSYLKHAQGDVEVDSDGLGGKLLSANVDVIYEDSGKPDVLNNLHFLISQDSPIRRVDIQIGPGDWTTYVIESDDDTWGYGRYHELTDKLLSDRNIYSQGRAPAPQILQEGTDNKWRAAAWEVKSNPKYTAVVVWLPLLWLVFLFEVAAVFAIVQSYYSPDEETAAEDQADKIAALNTAHWAGQHAWLIAVINFSYILLLVFVGRRMRSLLKSKVIFKSGTFLASLSFRKNDDTVQLLGLYLALIALIVSILTLAL